MSDIAIKVRNIGKEYRMGERHEYSTLRDSISSFTSTNCIKLIRTIYRRLNKRSDSSNSDMELDVDGNHKLSKPTLSNQKKSYDKSSNLFWSLKNISFEVRIGEIIGIIGRNGAGKSTLLKIITGITEPTEGRIEIYGRIASLLEVGTGFHLELTGRENIYLNGAILGMKKREIDLKFDEIVSFSEVGQFIDTPVKYYSSGMRVRLAFSVAAHLEPDILLIDEVLAVGDASFQKKCLGTLNNIATSEGRTVLFVSHDMTAILSLCDRTILLDNGRIIEHGETSKVVEKYFQSIASTNSIPLDKRSDREGDGSVLVTSLHVENLDPDKPIRPSSRLKFTIGYRSDAPVNYPRIEITIRDFKTGAKMVFLNSDSSTDVPLTLPSEGTIVCITDANNFAPGRCVVDIKLRKAMNKTDDIEHAGYFDVETEDILGSGKIPSRDQSLYIVKNKWFFEND